MDFLLCQFSFERVKRRLLAHHQIAGVRVDQRELFDRCKTVERRGHVARMCQFPQTRNAHGIKLVEVGCRNGQKPQAFQQRNPQVFGLFQDTPVEAKPA